LELRLAQHLAQPLHRRDLLLELELQLPQLRLQLPLAPLFLPDRTLRSLELSVGGVEGCAEALELPTVALALRLPLLQGGAQAVELLLRNGEGLAEALHLVDHQRLDLHLRKELRRPTHQTDGERPLTRTIGALEGELDESARGSQNEVAEVGEGRALDGLVLDRKEDVAIADGAIALCGAALDDVLDENTAVVALLAEKDSDASKVWKLVRNVHIADGMADCNGMHQISREGKAKMKKTEGR
jgi:hypothetical protein